MDRIIDGKAVGAEITEEIKKEVLEFSRTRKSPGLTVVIVGEDPASQAYVGMKVRKAEKIGIRSDLIEMPADISEEYLLDRVKKLNDDKDVDGILVQMPLPSHIDQQKVIETIDPSKDVDGFHPYSLGRLAAEKPTFVSCTPLGITVLLKKYGVETRGKKVTIVGRSLIVGKPMALLLSSKSDTGNATVTICHSRTEDLKDATIEADILIAAAGQPHMITGDMVKEGVVAIDVGTTRVEDPTKKKGYRLAGDIDFDSVYPRASLITPVPGGVGPMTVTMLMKNTLLAAKWARGMPDEPV
ncbi:MAG: bifunctional methylenetetrahydrofolate dehydrogenase/methenyltetrahydrofolate cyclohydrolase FolD [Bacteroidales bacterium]|nr:bifunctional methylenetetrahydrofolate dehydrogenase/methenyltetrahydrofolate cyclohydrolase FolD [Candidatus Latescibacterota bacterium]